MFLLPSDQNDMARGNNVNLSNISFNTVIFISPSMVQYSSQQLHLLSRTNAAASADVAAIRCISGRSAAALPITPLPGNGDGVVGSLKAEKI